MIKNKHWINKNCSAYIKVLVKKSAARLKTLSARLRSIAKRFPVQGFII